MPIRTFDWLIVLCHPFHQMTEFREQPCEPCIPRFSIHRAAHSELQDIERQPRHCRWPLLPHCLRSCASSINCIEIWTSHLPFSFLPQHRPMSMPYSIRVFLRATFSPCYSLDSFAIWPSARTQISRHPPLHPSAWTGFHQLKKSGFTRITMLVK